MKPEQEPVYHVAPENRDNPFYQDNPPLMTLRLGEMRFTPKMKRQPDGRWEMADLPKWLKDGILKEAAEKTSTPQTPSSQGSDQSR